MQYLGGKSRIAKQLAEVIDRVRKPGQLVWDPFCGGLSMAVALSKNGPVWATDVNAALINMYRAVQGGWDPPTEVRRETYQAAKSLPDTDPMKAFCGFGCSFGGKWFGGYAAGLNGPLTYPQLAARNVKRSVACVRRLDCGDFLSVPPQPLDAVLYLDPHYRGTTSYAGTPPFDHDLLARRVQAWAQYAPVFVSEYEFPVGRVVWEHASRGTLGRTHGVYHTERLYYLGPNQ
jgi:DNA adenine methylase